MESKIFDFISRYMLLTSDEKQAIVSLHIFRVVSRGTILLHGGQLSNEGYFALEGCLRTYYILNGEEKNRPTKKKFNRGMAFCLLFSAIYS